MRQLVGWNVLDLEVPPVDSPLWEIGHDFVGGCG
jgi:hypothetical protein